MSSKDFKKPVILAIDDDTTNLMLLVNILKQQYTVKVANGGRNALDILENENQELPDLILLDVMMPAIDGFAVCKQLKANPLTRDIPVIFLTAKNDNSDQAEGLNLGAADYVTKPIDPAILLARVKNHIFIKNAQDFLKDKNAFLEEMVQTRTAQLVAIQDVTIHAMASMAETRDNETGHHIRRTQHYVRVLAQQLRTHPRFSAFLNDEVIDSLFKSAPLHDIGKVGIPDSILLKPGKLDPDEFEIMKTHTTLGRDCIQRAESDLGIEIQFLSIAKEIAYSHQEKWDGSGYPQGLVADAIPISARLMALADVYDALISARVYKKPKTHDEAKQMILEGNGKHFDPDVVDAFLVLEEEFKNIALKYKD